MSQPANPHQSTDDTPDAALVYLSPDEAFVDLQVAAPYAASVPSARLIAAVDAVLRQENVAGGEVSLVVAGDSMLRQLNRDFRGVDAATDVLSFPARAEGDPGAGSPAFVSAPEAAAYLGDVIISYPTAQRHATAAGHPVDDELCLLAVHGTLHLLGYDHGTAEQEAAMWSVQDRLLRSMDIVLPVQRHHEVP
jgi:probable rRNA maturation factor